MPETYGGETFLSEEVSISLLQETRFAFQRCELVLQTCIILIYNCFSMWYLQLSGTSSITISENAEKILDILIQSLCQEHIDYAIELAFYGRFKLNYWLVLKIQLLDFRHSSVWAENCAWATLSPGCASSERHLSSFRKTIYWQFASNRQVTLSITFFSFSFIDLSSFSGTSFYESCSTKKRTAMSNLENKLSNGLDRYKSRYTTFNWWCNDYGPEISGW